MSKRRVVFIVTQDCQLRCNYCYLIGKNKAGKMTWETAKQIADYLMSLPVVEDEAIEESSRITKIPEANFDQLTARIVQLQNDNKSLNIQHNIIFKSNEKEEVTKI